MWSRLASSLQVPALQRCISFPAWDMFATAESVSAKSDEPTVAKRPKSGLNISSLAGRNEQERGRTLVGWSHTECDLPVNERGRASSHQLGAIGEVSNGQRMEPRCGEHCDRSS